MSDTLLLIFASSLLLALVLTGVVRRYAPAFGFTDKPDGRRKVHGRSTPLGGGLAIWAAAAAALAAGLYVAPGWPDVRPQPWQILFALLPATLLLCAVGVLDDYRLIKAWHKFLGQACAAGILIACGLSVQKIHVFDVEVVLGPLAAPFTLFFLLGAINSLNLLDGMDGMLGCVGLIITAAMAVMAALNGNPLAACVAAALAGALLGFLRYNLPPATIFLGDTGSMLIGLVVGVLAIQSCLMAPVTAALSTVWMATAPLAVLTIPILDTAAAIVRRKLTGRSICATDRGHLHHRLLQRGWSVPAALVCVALFCSLAVLGALATVYLKNELFALLSAGAVVGILVGVRLFGHAELMLVKDFFLGAPASLLGGRGVGPRTKEVRLQGTADWPRLWRACTGQADGLGLTSLRLDVNAPALHEGYHARWDRARPAGGEDPGLWSVQFPLMARGEKVGELRVAGWHTDEPVALKIERLADLAATAEKELARCCASARQTRDARALAYADAAAGVRRDPAHGGLPAPRVGGHGGEAPGRPGSRVLFLNRSYAPDVEATGQLLEELATDLAAAHHVTVIAGRPNFVDAPSPRGLVGHETRGGVEVVRVRNFRFSKKSLVGRAAGLLSYLALAAWAGLRQPRPDVIVVETDPPFLGLLGALLKWWHQCPLIYYLQDLFPEVGLQTGRLRPGVATWLLRRTTQVGLDRADRVVVLGEDMRRRVLARGVPADKVTIVPNWCDTRSVRPAAGASACRREWGLGGAFTVMYSGNMGLSQGLGHVLAAARALEGEPVQFVFVGDGASKAALQAQAEEWRLGNVRFLPYQPKGRLAESLTAADLHLIPLQAGLAGCIVPSKLYGILAAGVPYVAAIDADSEVARVTRAAGAGLVVPPDAPEALADAVRWCLRHPRRLRAMGRRGRRAAEREFDRAVSVAKFQRVLADVTAPAPDPAPAPGRHPAASVPGLQPSPVGV